VDGKKSKVVLVVVLIVVIIVGFVAYFNYKNEIASNLKLSTAPDGSTSSVILRPGYFHTVTDSNEWERERHWDFYSYVGHASAISFDWEVDRNHDIILTFVEEGDHLLDTSENWIEADHEYVASINGHSFALTDEWNRGPDHLFEWTINFHDKELSLSWEGMDHDYWRTIESDHETELSLQWSRDRHWFEESILNPPKEPALPPEPEKPKRDWPRDWPPNHYIFWSEYDHENELSDEWDKQRHFLRYSLDGHNKDLSLKWDKARHRYKPSLEGHDKGLSGEWKAVNHRYEYTLAGHDIALTKEWIEEAGSHHWESWTKKGHRTLTSSLDEEEDHDPGEI
jgi:hypothetical protein